MNRFTTSKKALAMEKKGDEGAVYVEFLVVIWPLLLLMFGLTQIGLMYGAHLLVCQAAAKAARAAIVIFPDENVDDYEGVEPNHIGETGDGDGGGETGEGGEGEGGGLDAYRNAPDGGRLEQIRMAAKIILAPAAPSVESYLGDSLSDGLGSHAVGSALAGAFSWNDFSTVVTFPAPTEETEGEEEDAAPVYLTEFTSRQMITAKVTYLYKCPVPIARSIMCHSYDELSDTAKAELDTVGASDVAGAGSTLLGWRFLALTAERTLPNQGRTKKQK